MLHAIAPNAAPVLAAASIDVDGTILVQMLLFWFVFIFLHFVLFRPYLKTVEAREEGVGGSREEAAEMEERAGQLIEEYEQKMRQARRDAQDVRESLRNQGLQEQTDMVDEVRGELQVKLNAEREKIDAKVAAAKTDLGTRSKQLARAMVDKLLPQA